MKILVTGRHGQVAAALAERAIAHPSLDFTFASRPELDLEDEASLRAAVHAHDPDVIVNAAAYTAVDRAEADEAVAHRVNALAPAILAEGARAAGARLIQLSTDYVFDGQGAAPYKESDDTGPISAYGRTKLAGEEAVRAALPAHLILRTAWVYSPFGRNFVRTMLGVAGERETLRVVGDQIGNPTSAHDIAAAVLTMLERWRDEGEGPYGTFHFAGAGSTSWADFARFVFAVSRDFGGPWADVVAISSAEWSTAAARPQNSRLDTAKFQAAFDHMPPCWRDSARRVVERLVRGRAIAGSGGTA
ncbi:MAG TPA: dTDP-4-dehydrorhamnose reductase [Allosphingosinicella sp.]|nr:dTDP-4-dehydrorhamnose reductase [Allosphingosinicella sp.]